MKFPKLKLPKFSNPGKIRLPNLIWRWLPTATTIVLVFGTMFLLLQQNARIEFNEEFIGIAESSALELSQYPTLPDQSTSPGQFDITDSTARFAIIVGEDFKPVYSTVRVDEQFDVVPPQGALEAAKANGQNIVTWQPKPGLRTAVVIRYFQGTSSGYIVVGKSLRDVYARTNRLLLITALSALTTLVVSLAFTHLTTRTPAVRTTTKALATPAEPKVEAKPVKKVAATKSKVKKTPAKAVKPKAKKASK